MTKLVLLREVAQSLGERLQMPMAVGEGEGQGEEESSLLAQLKGLLTAYLREVIDRRVGELAQLLYRLDVDESQVAGVMGEVEPARVPEALAELILARQLEKMRTRALYAARFSPDGGGVGASQEEASEAMALRSTSSSRHNKK